MKIISNKNNLTKILQMETNIGFVPTMGAIHKGHISLINKSISQCDATVVTIFVNKPQFNKKNDFRKYPRILKKDKLILKKLKIDFLMIQSSMKFYENP